MRLPTRNMKRAKFTCTQCAQCITACQTVQKDNPQGSLLDFTQGTDAMALDRKPSQFGQTTDSVKRIKIKNVE
jgi:Fe-S-cluster-containing dehydrogenase component